MRPAVAGDPNAGLPNAMAEYDESACETAGYIREWAESGWLNVTGGCCGTTPDHIRAIAEVVSAFKPREKKIVEKRLRLSGLEAVNLAAQKVASGWEDMVIAGGVESMSRAPFVMPKAESAFSRAMMLRVICQKFCATRSGPTYSNFCSGKSAEVTTALTPGSVAAFEVSIERMRAWACCERNTLRCSRLSNATSIV